MKDNHHRCVSSSRLVVAVVLVVVLFVDAVVVGAAVRVVDQPRPKPSLMHPTKPRKKKPNSSRLGSRRPSKPSRLRLKLVLTWLATLQHLVILIPSLAAQRGTVKAPTLSSHAPMFLIDRM